MIYQFTMNLLVNKSANLLMDQQIPKMFYCFAKKNLVAQKNAASNTAPDKNLSSAIQTVDLKSITDALS